MARRSTGSCTRPSTSRVSTRGWPTVSSKPSRRISSTRTASCSSPRPCTSQVSGRSVGSTRIETLPTSSCSSRVWTWRAVSAVPSRPASGEVLMPTTIEIDGSSTASTGSGRGSSGSASVSPIVTSGSPATRDQLARAGLVDLHPLQRLGDLELTQVRRAARCRRRAPMRSAGRRGSCRDGRGRGPAGPGTGRRRGCSPAPGAGAPDRARAPGCG